MARLSRKPQKIRGLLATKTVTAIRINYKRSSTYIKASTGPGGGLRAGGRDRGFWRTLSSETKINFNFLLLIVVCYCVCFTKRVNLRGTNVDNQIMVKRRQRVRCRSFKPTRR